MSLKQKGINAERELLHRFWSKNWACLRIAGSGSMKYPSPDLLVSNKLRRLAIECKVTKETRKYFERDEIESLRTFADMFGAEPWVAIRFRGNEWLFATPEDLDQTDRSFVASLEKLKNRGLLFEEMVT